MNLMLSKLLFFTSLFISWAGFSHQVMRDTGFVFCQTDLIYGKNKTQAGIEQELVFDVWMPNQRNESLSPLIVLAHGGYFLGGDKRDMNFLCEQLVRQGFVVANINYRLLDVAESEISYKRAVVDAVFDMKAAVRYFKRDACAANNFKIDTNAIFVGGYSAGAITSLHYAYANTIYDAYQIGGNLMINYCHSRGGAEGNSGNQGYSSKVRGVINVAGSLHNASLIDAYEPSLFSVHGTADDIVPFTEGVSGNSEITTHGSGLIHSQADQIGLRNELVKIEGADHFAIYECTECLQKLASFIWELALQVH